MWGFDLGKLAAAGRYLQVTETEPRYAAFVSYASEDRDAASEVADRLEEAGHVCWIAPRDIRAGQSYGAEIIRGIECSNAIVLVLSQHSKFVNTSGSRAGLISRGSAQLQRQ